MKNYLILTAVVVISFFVGRYFVNINSTSKMQNNIKKISAVEFKNEIDKDSSVILDIRTPEEFNGGKIVGAINIDYYENDFKEELSKLDKNKNYKIYCNSGNRSASALKIMQDMGFKSVSELSGGIQAWKASQLPVCRNC